MDEEAERSAAWLRTRGSGTAAARREVSSVDWTDGWNVHTVHLLCFLHGLGVIDLGSGSVARRGQTVVRGCVENGCHQAGWCCRGNAIVGAIKQRLAHIWLKIGLCWCPNSQTRSLRYRAKNWLGLA